MHQDSCQCHCCKSIVGVNWLEKVFLIPMLIFFAILALLFMIVCAGTEKKLKQQDKENQSLEQRQKINKTA